ncbi:MAG: Na+/H+ antiporter subunit E [Sterolibacterium sp.]
MARSISAFAALFVFWLLLSGIFTPFLIIAGAGSAIVVVLFARRMEVIDPEGHPDRLVWLSMFTYWPWLAKEIGVAAWDVTKRTLHPQLPISPTLIEFAPTQRTVMGLVIHANSITLTPGTISVEVEPGRFLVHALTQEGADGLTGSEMDRRCTALETRR